MNFIKYYNQEQKSTQGIHANSRSLYYLPDAMITKFN